jgi:hypothetical protein
MAKGSYSFFGSGTNTPLKCPTYAVRFPL